MTNSPRTSRLRAGLLASALGLLVMFGLAELGTRAYLHWFADDVAFLRFASIGQLQESNRFNALVVRHSYLGYALKPGYEKGSNRINSLGYRGAEFPQVKPEGEFRIVCMGGSTTYGAGELDYALAYPGQLERALHDLGHDQVRVVNAGVSGYTSWETLANYLYRVSDIDPNLVVIYHGVNDILTRFTWPPETFRADNSAYRSPSEQVYWPGLHEHSTALRMIAIQAGLDIPHSLLDRQFGGRGPGYLGTEGQSIEMINRMLDANTPRYFQQNLERLALVAHHNGVRVLFVSFAHCTGFPNRSESNSPYFERAYAEMNETFKFVAESTKSLYFDLASQFPDDLEHFVDPVHMTVRGCELQGGLIAEFIAGAGVLPD